MIENHLINTYYTTKLERYLITYYLFNSLIINKLSQIMLNDKDNSEGLLGKTSSASPALNNNNNNSIDEVFPKPNDSKVSKKREKRQDTQFTSVLKFFNIIIGLMVVAFGICCYKFFNNETQNLQFVGLILPGYISFSGLIILLIECNLNFIIRNMRFLYNFFGRGLFNIYVGIMPLSLIRDGQDQTFQIIIIVMVSLMCLIGVLYIIAKIFCCAKQDVRTKKRRNSESSDSD